MTIQQLFVRANEELKKVVDQIRDDQWEVGLPAGLSSKPTTLRGAVNYHAYDDAWVPDVLAGKTKEEVGSAYDFLLKTDDTKKEYAAYNLRAIEAVRGFDDLDKTVHLSYGDFSAAEYLQHITLFRGLRSYDIAKLIGVDTTMAPDLVDGLYAEYAPLAESFRRFGILPPALPIAEGADAQAKLLALVGREN